VLDSLNISAQAFLASKQAQEGRNSESSNTAAAAWQQGTTFARAAVEKY